MTPWVRTARADVGKERRRVRAWKAPRILKAPLRWRFSHLKKREILGWERGVEFKDEGWFCGEEARVLRVVLVRRGVRWM